MTLKTVQSILERQIFLNYIVPKEFLVCVFKVFPVTIMRYIAVFRF